jgi:hypothetical protein
MKKAKHIELPHEGKMQKSNDQADLLGSWVLSNVIEM